MKKPRPTSKPTAATAALHSWKDPEDYLDGAAPAPTAKLTVTGRPVHPALHFEPGFASVGILDPTGKPILVTRLGTGKPARVVPVQNDDEWVLGSRRLHPAPMTYARFNDRWNSADVDQFCTSGYAEGFMDFLNDLRDGLNRLIEFPRPEHASLIAHSGDRGQSDRAIVITSIGGS